MLYAQVVVKQRTQVQELTYALSAQIVPYIKVGSLVAVPLRQRSVQGVVVSFSRTVASKLKSKIKTIEKLAPGDELFSAAQIAVTRQLADYYAAPLAEVAFHSIDLPNFWPAKSSSRMFQPLVISGPWPVRCEAYQRIIEKSSSRLLFIFAQRVFADDFYATLPAHLQRSAMFYLKDHSHKKQIKAAQQPGQKIIIGTLGEAFFPLQAGDTIIVDQPSHIGAKSQLRPFMSAERIASTRSSVESLRVIFGDSLPRPAQLLAIKEKRWRLATAKSISQPLTVIDRRGQKQLIAPSLDESLTRAIQSGQKVLVLVLARGLASALVCRDCGYTWQCQNCQRTSAVNGTELRCHYCATTASLPKICPACQSINLQAVGEGVSAVKNALITKFPDVKVVELSGDAPEFDQSAQLIVATEKIFSWPDAKFDQTFILSADRLLSGADLDGAWRFLGILIELQSRSKQIMAQTFYPDSRVWAAAAGAPRPFFAEELTNRRALRLPPYGAVIKIRGSAANTDSFFVQAEKISGDVLKLLPTADISYPEIDSRSGNSYHGHLTLYLSTPPVSSLKTKLAESLPPSWHLDLD